MRKIFLFIFSILFISLTVTAQNYTISGYITESKSGESVISASVFDVNLKKGAVSNVYGFYSLTLPKGDVDLNYSYVGFETQQRKFTLNKDTVINIKMLDRTELSEIVVIGNRNDIGVQGTQMSAIDVPISQIKSVPTLFGETDVLKALQLLPGVQAGTEGSAGFYVRGGGPDENLFLLDGVPVYNVNHMGGFFSVFNADAIKNVTLYKGGFPARFGGRLSSVVDIRMNDGNDKTYHGNFSIGLISSKINFEGPIIKEKTTFNISARRTYFDILAQPFIKLAAAQGEGVDKMSAGYYFYDMNAKVSHKISDKDRLYLSVYSGDDVIYSNFRESYREYSEGSYENRLKMNWDWGNFITALRWNRMVSNKLFMNTTATYTQYRFNMYVGSIYEETTKNPPRTAKEDITLGYKSGINDWGAKVDFDYNPHPNHDIKFGASLTNHNFRPGVYVAQMKTEENNSVQKNDTTIGNQNIRANETALYIEDNLSINHAIKLNAGLHYSTFMVQNEFYHSLQPRLGMRLLLSDNLSAKAGYAHMNQYIHLLSNNNISLPTDLWVPVTKRIEPMRSHQYSAGLFYNLLNTIDLSVEGYYKSMHNLIEYKDGASFWGSDTGWEDKVSMGRGWAYGVEFLAQKSIGKTTGWIGYTWAKSERLFNRPGDELNDGKVFPAKYDRRHDISITASHHFSKKFDLAATWVYSTGQAGTLALQEYTSIPLSGDFYEESTIPHISHRNNYRYPDYHRLDFGANFHKQKKNGTRTWNISVYNAYNQMNPFLIYQSNEYSGRFIVEETELGTNTYYTAESKKVLKKLTIFTLIPSISYSYKF